MFKDPELSGKYLGTISQDFVKVSDNLRESSYQIRKAGFAFPIFVISRQPIPIAQVLFERELMNLEWNYYASFLDELVQRELVAREKEADFNNTYKGPDEYCCLFVVDEEFTNFVFIPYPED